MGINMLKPSILVAAAAALFIVPGCKKVASDDLKDTVPYHQAYTVDYNKSENKTSASAIFRVRESSGTKVDLNNGASVTANSKSPSNFQLVPGEYTWNFDGIVDVSFELTKNSGQKFVNVLNTTDIGDIAFQSNFPLSVSKASGFSFSWQGDPLVAGESLTVKVTGSPLSTNVTASIDKTITGAQVNITSDDLKDFAPGTIFITLERKKNLALDAADGTAGGDISASIKTRIDAALNP